MSSIEGLHSIIKDISTGFETLLEQLDTQRRIETNLRQQLGKAVNRFSSNNSANTSDVALSSWQDEIVKQISPIARKDEQILDLEVLPEVARAKEAIEKLRANMAPLLSPQSCPVTNKSVLTDGGETPASVPRKCPVMQKKQQISFDEMEQDFTIPGKPSNLECPFASMTRNGPLKGESHIDPIAAEFHPDALSAQSLDEAKACNKCPIRFLDKHSPEELAEYFEKHKHELPRSHEICVKRYQQNESSIRQLDEKYGNIVSMIQGLGNKHKQYLPSGEQVISGSEQQSLAAVEKWAKSVHSGANMANNEVELDKRQSHFDKPLRDVRVGESPTRPWGIHVPMEEPQAVSAISSQAPPASPSIHHEAEKPAIKPVTDGLAANAPTSTRSQSYASCKRSRNRRPNQIIFNGPVFLGYSPEQAATFLQQLNTNCQT